MVSVLRSFLHSLEDYLLHTVRDIRIDSSWALRDIVHMHNSDSNRVIAVERLLSAEHLIHHSADRVDIALSVCNVASCLLRADIVNASDSLIGSSSSLFTGELCDAEVHDLDSAVAEHHYILRLYITVNYALIMSVLERTEYLYHKVYSILPCKDFFLLDVFFKGNAVDVLHNDILELFRESHIVYLNDIRMREYCNSL